MLKTIALAISLLTGHATDHHIVQSLAAATQDAHESTGIEWELLVAVGHGESGLDPTALSSVGAMGPWQLLAKYHTDVINKCGMWPELCMHFHALAAARSLRHYAAMCPGLGRTVRAYRSGLPGGYCAAPRPRDLAVVRTRNLIHRMFKQVGGM